MRYHPLTPIWQNQPPDAKISLNRGDEMSTVFEPAIGGGLAPKSANSNGAATRREREITPLGINAQKVVAKRYSLKDENGEAVETWADIVRRVVGHVSRAEA